MGRPPKSYLVKRGSKRFKISKDDLKARNLELVMEYKTASPGRRSEILSEYFDLNRSFCTYFPKFREDYREEIINTFISMLPDFFLKYNPDKGTEINSYLSMFCKKEAIRDFLQQLPAVRCSRTHKDKDGRTVFEKARMIRMDAMVGLSGATEEHAEDPYLDVFLGKTVFKDFLSSGQDGASAFFDGHDSYTRYFTGIHREIVRGIEDGLVAHEIMERVGLSKDKFRSAIVGIRMQLQRIMTDGGKTERRPNRPTNRNRPRRRASPDVCGDWSDAGRAWDEGPGAYGDIEAAFGGVEEKEDEGPFFVEGDGPEGCFSEGEGA